MKRLLIALALLCTMSFVTADIGQEIEYTSSPREQVAHRGEGQALLKIKDIRHDPYVASPGEYIDVYMKLENTGGTISNPSFDLELPVPFSLDEATQYSNMPTIEPGEKLTLQFRIKTDENAIPDDHELRFIIKNNNEAYASYYFVLEVDDVVTDFDIALQEVNKDGVALAIANIGKNDANAITVSLANQQDFELLGPANTIIGNLNAGDYTILTAYLKPKVDSKQQNIIVKIDYTDTVGNRRTIHKTVPVEKTPKTQSGFEQLEAEVLEVDTQEKQGSNFFMYTTIILLVIMLVLYIRKRKKK